MNCQKIQNELPGLLLDPTAPVDPVVTAHLSSCAPCASEFKSLQATMFLLDEWTAPEPSPYFDQKMAVRLREEVAAPPMTWLERLQARLAFNTGRQFRPILTGALATAILIGGGSFSAMHLFMSTPPVEASSTVKDLQILDRNEQAFQQMDQLLDDDSTSTDDNAPAPPPIS